MVMGCGAVADRNTMKILNPENLLALLRDNGIKTDANSSSYGLYSLIFTFQQLKGSETVSALPLLMAVHNVFLIGKAFR